MQLQRTDRLDAGGNRESGKLMDIIELVERDLEWLRKARADWNKAFEQCPSDDHRQLELCARQIESLNRMIAHAEQFLSNYKPN